MAVTVPPNTAPGNYTINVKGISSTFSWAENVTVQVITGIYFTMTVQPELVSIPEGSLQTLTVSLTGQTGFNAQVDLYPYPSNRSFTVSQNPPGDLWVYDGQTTRATLTINGTQGPLPGNYALWLEATTVYLPVTNAIQIIPMMVYGPSGPSPDFSLSTKPDTLSIGPGSSATTKLMLTSQTGFSGTVALSCSSSLSCSVSPGSVTLSSGGNATSIITVSAGSGTGSGTYTVSLTATSNGISHTIPVAITVTGSFVSVPPLLFYSGIGALVVAAAVGAIFLRSRRKIAKPHLVKPLV